MMIVLPHFFAQVLKAAPELEAAVRSTFFHFEPWLSQSGMPFFPGYTDHSPTHINEVLEASASLIADESRACLSPADVAVLSVAVLLHDAGMHLTPDIFRVMIEESAPALVPGFDDKPWDVLWRVFLGEASRFGQEKLTAIFGDAIPVDIDALNLSNLTERDHLLIGEFVRRHHTRIAHEIAVRGIGVSRDRRLEIEGLDRELSDLAGLVARSHGMSIRSTFPYIKRHYGLLTSFREVKAPYLMAVLRIADYIQVHSERAIEALLNVKELRSPISRQEWMAHFAVRNVSTDHEDPEALYVHAKPTDVGGYLKLTSLFLDIQRELDVSWSTLGEVYGRHQRLAALGITIRRIRSNLDNTGEFAATVPYIPIRARFDSSGPDLLRLLVGPLYNYDYKVGIRELLQNAVDACRERLDVQIGDGGNSPELFKAKVVVSITQEEDGRGTISVTDNGVGMSLDTVVRYFLIAGASFRNSDLWKRQHLDDKGMERVARGGRFGVGALAAFLLGEELHVRTRHESANENEGVEFNARIDDSTLELKRCSAPIGTTVTVKVSDRDVFNQLRPVIYSEDGMGYDLIHGVSKLERWDEVDWFADEEPMVEYLWYGCAMPPENLLSPKPPRLRARYVRAKRDLVPRHRDDLVDMMDWRALENPSPYKEIFWLRRRNTEAIGTWWLFRSTPIFVNGIYVEGAGAPYPLLQTNGGVRHHRRICSATRPPLSIVDPSGICPINLQRNAIAFDRMGFEEKIAEAVMLEVLGEWWKKLPPINTYSDFVHACQAMTVSPEISYPGPLYPLAFCQEGVFLLTPDFLVKSCGDRFYVIDECKENASVPIRSLARQGEIFVVRTRNDQVKVPDRLEWFRNLFQFGWIGLFDLIGGVVPGWEEKPVLMVSLVDAKHWEFISKKKRVRRKILESIKVKPCGADAKFLLRGEEAVLTAMGERMAELRGQLKNRAEISGCPIGLPSIPDDEPSLVEKVWLRIFGDMMLPRRSKAAGKRS